ncbi:alpha/beta hydrolase [bacterium]|nr:alpha/beta hydrolase [bacterium]
MEELTAGSEPRQEPKPRGTWKGFFARRLVTVALLYFGFFGYAMFFADRMIFRPQPSSYQDSPEILKLTTRDGTKISARYRRSPRATYTILYSHGNANDMGDVDFFLEELVQSGFSAFVYDYRGYGTSEGQPSERTTYEDVDAAFAHLTEKLSVPEDRIISFGSSLGGGPAIDLASRKNLAGLIAQSTFVSAYRVVTGFRILPFDEFENLRKIPLVKCPVLVMHGKEDSLIKLWHGERLLAAANEPKMSFWVEGAGHNDFYSVAGMRLFARIKEFAKLLDERRSGGR